MYPFHYRKAATIEDALVAAQAGGRYIAGGTTLIDLMREEVERPADLVDINALPLNYIRFENDMLIIGATSRMAEVSAHLDVALHQPILVETLNEGASPQLRNVASIGGNLLQRTRCPYFRMSDAACNKRDSGSGCSAMAGVNHNHALLGASDACAATHPSDLAVSLVALEATVHVQGPAGSRSFPVDELFLLPGNTPHLEHALRAGEMITEVRVPIGPSAATGSYVKVRDRASYEFALTSAAVLLHVESDVILSARVACGGVGTRPWRMHAVEQALTGKPVGRTTFQDAAALSVEEAEPLSQNGYKLTLLPRTIVRALERAGGIA